MRVGWIGAQIDCQRRVSAIDVDGGRVVAVAHRRRRHRAGTSGSDADASAPQP
jgi:phytoene dehydrogenase-like protein